MTPNHLSHISQGPKTILNFGIQACNKMHKRSGAWTCSKGHRVEMTTLMTRQYGVSLLRLPSASTRQRLGQEEETSQGCRGWKTTSRPDRSVCLGRSLFLVRRQRWEECSLGPSPHTQRACPNVSLCKDPILSGKGPNLMTSFSLNCFLRGSISKNSHSES